MNDESYENIMNYINNEIKIYKLKVNFNYGSVSHFKKQKEMCEKIYENFEDLISIRLFVRCIHRNAFDKRFFDLMFGTSILPYVDTRKLTKAIVDLLADAHKTFPRKVKE